MQSISSSSQQQSKNVQSLSQVRILQKNTVYVIGISPSIAKEDILRRYEYFGQYGRIQSVTINKDNVYQPENSKLVCYSVYIAFSTPQEASIAILAVDQHVYDSRLIRASFGRTKYCKFFLKDSACLNKDCPYMHEICSQSEILSQDDMHKKQLFQQCQQLAFELSQICQMDQNDFKLQMKKYRDQYYPGQQNRPLMPQPEHIFDKKILQKLLSQYMKTNPQRKPRKMTIGFTGSSNSTTELFDRSPAKNEYQAKERTYSMNNKDVTYQKKAQPVSNGSPETIATNDATGLTNQNKEEVKASPGQQQQKEKSPARQQKTDLTLVKQPQSAKKLIQNVEITFQKRTNSSDERMKSFQAIGPDDPAASIKSLSRIHNFEQQLANSLIRHLGPKEDMQHSQPLEAVSTGQSMSIFNEKKESRFLSLRDNDGDDEIDGEQNDYQDSPFLSRRPSFHEKKNSMHSLLVESLKFLNDDTDVVPKKREPLIQQQLYKTNPPSEVLNIGQATPAPSQIGGFPEEDPYWNNTLFSQYDNQTYQQTMQAFDDKSYYSHQVVNTHINFNKTLDMKHSINTSTHFNQQFMRSTAFNESLYNKTASLSNQFKLPIGAQFGNQAQECYTSGRRTLFLNEQKLASSIVGQGASIQLTRSPSQPNLANNAFNQTPQNTDSIPFQMNKSSPWQQTSFRMDSCPFQKADLVGQSNAFGQPVPNNQRQSAPFQKPDPHHLASQGPIGGQVVNNGKRVTSGNIDLRGQYPLNQYNLDLFDRQYEGASKDLLYAKIFLQDGVQSHNGIVSSQSLFCYNSSLIDEEHSYTYNKYSDRHVPFTPIKSGKQLYQPSTEYEDDLDDKFRYEREDDNPNFSGLGANGGNGCGTATKQKQPKNYYQEFLFVQESLFAPHNFRQKRRNSLDHDRDLLQPQQLQFNSSALCTDPSGCKPKEKKQSNSRSPPPQAKAPQKVQN